MGVKSSIWLLAFFLAITYVLSTPMGHEIPFKTYKFQELSQWYKGIFNPMSFDPWNRFLKIRESITTPTLKVRAHLGMWGLIPSHSPTLSWAWNVTPRASLLACTFVSLCFDHELKIKVVTLWLLHKYGTLNMPMITHVCQPTPSKIGIHIYNSQSQFLELSHPLSLWKLSTFTN